MPAMCNNKVYQSVFSVLICVIKQRTINYNLGFHLLDFKLLCSKHWILLSNRFLNRFFLKRNVFD